MTEQTFLDMIAEIAEADVAIVTLNSKLDSLNWDSLCDISFIAAMDRETGREVDVNGLAQCKTVADLYALFAATS